MKTATILLSFILIHSFSALFAQEQTIQLQLKEGYEYVFEKTENRYSELQDGSKKFNNVRKRIYKIEVEKFVPGEQAILKVTHLENYDDKTGSSERGNKVDFFFPAFVDQQAYIYELNYLEPLLCMFDIRFNLNLKTREVTVVNRDELIETYSERLFEQGYSEKEVSEIIRYIDEKQLDKRKDLVSFLTWFQNSAIRSGELQNSRLQDRFIVQNVKDKFVNFGDENSDDLISGKWYKKYWLDTETGIVTDFSSIKIESASPSAAALYKSKWHVQENNFTLVSSTKIKPNFLTVSGKIENPLSNKVHVKFMEAPFGTELKSVTTFLDENGAFEITFPFSKKGLVYIENENNNKHNPPGTVVLYAEPGDSLKFEATGEEFPWELTFDGNRKDESNLIYELRKKITFSNPSTGNNGKLILDRRINLGSFIIIENGEKRFSDVSDLNQLGSKIGQVNKISEKYKSDINSEVYEYITNEIKNYFLSAAYNPLSTYFSNSLYSDYFDISAIDFPEINKLVNSYDIESMYNDYGLQSRKLVNSYINYQYTKTQKYTGVSLRYLQINNTRYRDVDQNVQFAKMVISGSPLYREVAGSLNEILSFNNYLPYDTRPFTREAADRYLELIIRTCSEKDLVARIKRLKKQQKKVLTNSYVPKIKFQDKNKNTITYSDFFGEKPTVFHISSSWGRERYLLDEYATNHPEINFVLATDGNNFREWKEYNERAEPVATQLFFKNDSITFKELILKSDLYIVFDKNGNLAGFSDSVEGAYKKAEKCLQAKKAIIDYSVLRNIILVFGIVLFFVILTILIVRWQGQRKLKKENQLRRFRELELTAIRSQMNPHFLFNSLNSVQNLIQQNKGKEAHVYLSDFAGLIRKVLKNSEKQESSLAEELEMAEQYLKLEKLRFDFDYSIEADESIDIQNTMVPSMLLQPFAENAVIHGLQNKTSDRKLQIEAAKTTKGIKITIEDNGIGREAAKKIEVEKNGKGIKMNKERLELLREKYGEKYRLEIIDLKVGTRVEIIIPEEK